MTAAARDFRYLVGFLSHLGAGRQMLEEGDWRNEMAREQGVPPYVICTNRQLAAVAHSRPATAAGLAQVEGIGPARVKRYGEALLRVVGGGAGGVAAPETPEPGVGEAAPDGTAELEARGVTSKDRAEADGAGIVGGEGNEAGTGHGADAQG